MCRAMPTYDINTTPRNVRLSRLGSHYRLYAWACNEPVCVYWPIKNPDRWSAGDGRAALGFDAWAFGPIEDEPLLITRTPAAWLRRPDSWCPLYRDPKWLGVDLLAAGRALAFTNDADAAWARQCIASVTMPRMPRMLVERQMARAA